MALQLFLRTKDKGKDKASDNNAKDDNVVVISSDEETKVGDDVYHAFKCLVPVIIINPCSLVQAVMEEKLGVQLAGWDASVTLSNRYTVVWVFATVKGKVFCVLACKGGIRVFRSWIRRE